MKKIRSFFLVLLALFSLALFVPGCVYDDEVRESRDKAVQEKATLDAQITEAKSQLKEIQTAKDAAVAAEKAAQAAVKTIPENDPQRGEALKKLADIAKDVEELATAAKKSSDDISAMNSKSDGLAAAIVKADKALADDGSSNSGTIVGGLVATLLPGVGLSVVPLLGSFYRQMKLASANRALKSNGQAKTQAIEGIVKSIDVLGQLEPAVREAISKHKQTVDQIQGMVGKSAVDAVQSKRSIPFNPSEPGVVVSPVM